MRLAVLVGSLLPHSRKQSVGPHLPFPSKHTTDTAPIRYTWQILLSTQCLVPDPRCQETCQPRQNIGCQRVYQVPGIVYSAECSTFKSIDNSVGVSQGIVNHFYQVCIICQGVKVWCLLVPATRAMCHMAHAGSGPTLVSRACP